MEPQTFTGWVEKILDGNDYEAKVTVRNYKDDDDAAALKANKSWPVTLMFSLSTKNGCAEQLKGIGIGDKVNVQFYLSGKSGVSKKSGAYYCINTLNVAKNQGFTLLERAKSEDAPAEEDDNIPF